ncbi:nitrate reductase (quinol-dependent), catalytic subunit [Singulisphaera sp. GP187]|uniref:molybdopterin oxidoreductase family protein n=1 Tax=Singulisphaera sp. GP187 TaxID=1882752 RepID=UPI00092CA59F|nr:nitrate reductase [Singulisphaera sp. GP187]SIO24768.1 nitrate reductase (quinol-dependent), catalytic subunit [Singulisphaera sp. GP187]
MTATKTILHKLRSLVRARDGILTQELLRTPGKFGLGQVPALKAPDATTGVVCGYCSTGCGLTIHLREGEAVNLSPSADYPVNLGMACPKGWEALTVLEADDRATTPLLRDDDGVRRPVDWHTAMETFANRFKAIQAAHGDDSVAFLSTGQIATEEMALLGAVAKFGMGMKHGDGNTRQCMATAVVAYKQAFGFDAPPYTYQDFEESDCIVLVGSNLCIAHPIMWERVMKNRHAPEIIVVDPRRTETAVSATLHLPVRPKTDLVLFYGLANLMIEKGWVDRSFVEAHTSGFDDYARFVRRFGLLSVAYETGIEARQIEQLADLIRRKKRVSFWWTMGVNQSHEGVRTAQAIINLALLTGNIGRPGTGANSITGQCNAMGSRLFSNTTGLLGGHDFANPAHRSKVADVLEIPEAKIQSQAGWSYDRIVEGIREGKIRGLWVIATNPAHSWIHQGDFRELLGRLDFLVVQDMYDSTETALSADLLLPAAGWGEKEGTFINSERRVGLIKKVRRAPGKALSDFHIFKLAAHYYGCGAMFERWESPESVFQILKALSAGQPCDITGVRDYRALDEARGIQWPYPDGSTHLPSQRRLFTDGRFYHPDGRARFVFENPRPMGESPDDEYPFLLLTGRGSASQWHTQTRTAKSGVLRKLYPAGLHAEIHPADARWLGIGPGQAMVVESRRGRVHAKAFVTPTVPQGQVFLPMHDPATNALTYPDFDPNSRQPAYKGCAVRIRPEGPDDAPEEVRPSKPARALNVDVERSRT